MGNFNSATTPSMVEGTPSSRFLYLIFFSFVFIFSFLVLYYYFFYYVLHMIQFDWYWHGFRKKFWAEVEYRDLFIIFPYYSEREFQTTRNLLQMSVTRWTIFTFYPIFLIGSVLDIYVYCVLWIASKTASCPLSWLFNNT
jgi:hypothetical protein